MSSKISHSGIIDSILGDHIRVRIVQSSACAVCKVAGHCNAAESKVKIVDITSSCSKDYTVGQEVVVSVSRNVANRALLFGFGLPFLLLFSVLFIAFRLTGSEGVSALLAIGVLPFYYLLLWFFRDRVQQDVSFRIEDN